MRQINSKFRMAANQNAMGVSAPVVSNWIEVGFRKELVLFQS